MASGKILVIRGGAIGDFILTLPVLSALRKNFPGVRLEVLGYPHVARLALAGQLADGVRSIEAGPLAGFFAAGTQLDTGLRNYFASFAVIVSFLYDPDAIFQTNVSSCFHGQFIAGPHRPDEAAGIHATHTFLKPLERLAIFGADAVPRLRLETDSSITRGACLAVHPGSGSESKNWPEPRWAGFLDRLVQETPWRLLLAGGEAEGTRLERLAAALPADRVEVARSLPLVELAGRLAACRGFVGHDSGISHLAAALELPTLVLWGHTSEAVWRPQGTHVRVLRPPKGLATLPVEEVLAAVKSLV